jgi:thiosulfate dehydrogenase [quinone] large subunit
MVQAVAAVVAVVSLAYLINPWFAIPNPEERDATIQLIMTWTFWISFIVLIVAMFAGRKEPGATDVEIQGPAFSRYLFYNSRAGLFWLPIRLFVGIAWLDAGLHKLTGGGWVDGGSALRSYWERAAAIPEEGRPPITYEWYRDFIQLLLDNGAESWFAWVITLGEVAVGVGLLIGMLTGVAAFFGAFMNMSFLLAGSASTNPVLFTLAIGLILAWRVAGYYGVDRYLLPILGAPWSPGALFKQKEASAAATG